MEGKNVPVVDSQSQSPTPPSMPISQDQHKLFVIDSEELSHTKPSREHSTDSTSLDLKSPSMLQIRDAVNAVKRVSPDTQAPVFYIRAYDIPSDTFTILWDNFNLFQGVTTTLWRQSRTALFRIMPNEQHECPAAVFQLALAELLLEMGLSTFRDDYTPTGSARYNSTDLNSSKEADAAFSPGPRLSSGRLQPPSLVIEVGLSETRNKLHQDARWWSDSAQNPPSIVVLICVTRNPQFHVQLEVWTPGGTPIAHNDRSRIVAQTPSRPSLECTQRVSIVDGVVHNGPLTLDFSLLMRRAPVPPERNLILGDVHLLKIAARVE